jgi:hypothetical protein
MARSRIKLRCGPGTDCTVVGAAARRTAPFAAGWFERGAGPDHQGRAVGRRSWRRRRRLKVVDDDGQAGRRREGACRTAQAARSARSWQRRWAARRSAGGDLGRWKSSDAADLIGFDGKPLGFGDQSDAAGHRHSCTGLPAGPSGGAAPTHADFAAVGPGAPVTLPKAGTVEVVARRCARPASSMITVRRHRWGAAGFGVDVKIPPGDGPTARLEEPFSALVSDANGLAHMGDRLTPGAYTGSLLTRVPGGVSHDRHRGVRAR